MCSARNEALLTLLLFLPDDLELCNGFQVLRMASRRLGPNEHWQVEAAALDDKDRHFDDMLQQIFIAASPVTSPGDQEDLRSFPA